MFVPEKLYNCVFGLTPDLQFNVWLGRGGGMWKRKKRNLQFCGFLFCVGVDGFEPPTLCL